MLTAAERQKFADWLEQDAASDRALLPGLEAMGPAVAALVKSRKLDIAAKLHVARIVRSIESETITAPSGS